jgi:hypothetical protein
MLHSSVLQVGIRGRNDWRCMEIRSCWMTWLTVLLNVNWLVTLHWFLQTVQKLLSIFSTFLLRKVYWYFLLYATGQLSLIKCWYPLYKRIRCLSFLKSETRGDVGEQVATQFESLFSIFLFLHMWVAWWCTDENPCQPSVKAKHQYAWFEGK